MYINYNNQLVTIFYVSSLNVPMIEVDLRGQCSYGRSKMKACRYASEAYKGNHHPAAAPVLAMFF